MLIVAAVVIAIVFAFQIGTSALPAPVQNVVFHTPLAIAVLVIGTVGLLVGLARRPRS